MTEDATAARLAELEADNARLRRLLDERDAPGELRHRLRNTLAMLRVIIRQSAEKTDDFEGYVAHLEDRLDAISRAQSAADQYGVVNLHALIADELDHYKAEEGDQIRLSGPTVLLQPRPAQVLALAMHELAVNAIEHGVLMLSGGRIYVDWQVTADGVDPELTLTWKEVGSKKMAEPKRQGFGMEVLHKTLRYELKADTNLAYEPDGLRCTMYVPLTARIGRVEGQT